MTYLQKQIRESHKMQGCKISHTNMMTMCQAHTSLATIDKEQDIK